MTGINGVDPIIVDKLKIPTQKPAVIEAGKIKVKDDHKEREGGQQRRSPRGSSHELILAVNKLNRFLEQNKISLHMQLVDFSSTSRVLLLDSETCNIIVVMPAEKVLALVKTLSLKGFSINELI